MIVLVNRHNTTFPSVSTSLITRWSGSAKREHIEAPPAATRPVGVPF